MTEASQATEAPATEAPAGLGHNNPPFSVELAERQAALKLKVEALIGEANALPAVIETEDQHERATGIVKRAAETLKEIETAHGDEKKPFSEKTKVIDEFFLTKGLKGRLEPTKNLIAGRNGAYQDRLAQKRAEELAEEAKRNAAAAQQRMSEAATLEDQGRHTEAAVAMEGAQALDIEAGNAAIRSEGPAKELGRSFTSAGTSSLIITATPIVDGDEVDLEKLRPFLAIDALEAAVRAMVKAKGLKPQQLLDGALVVKGVTFKRNATSR